VLRISFSKTRKNVVTACSVVRSETNDVFIGLIAGVRGAALAEEQILLVALL
jgi:hypothetical protein